MKSRENIENQRFTTFSPALQLLKMVSRAAQGISFYFIFIFIFKKVILFMLLSDLLQIIELFMPFFCVPICIALFSSILRIIKSIAQGNIEIGEREAKEEEINKDTEKKIDIDRDLQKYFNYKEEKQ